MENVYKNEISKKYNKWYDDLNCTIEKTRQELEIQAQKLQLEKEKAKNVENLRKISSLLSMTEFRENNALDAILSDITSLYNYLTELEEEYTKSVIMLHNLKEDDEKKAIALQDQVFDSKQEILELQMNYEFALEKQKALEEENKILKTDYAYSQNEWADQKLKLTSTIQVLSMVAQEAEDKQILYEGEIIKLKDEITLLKDEAKCAEENQFKLEDKLTEISEEKERCIAKCSLMDMEIVGLKKQEEDIKNELVASWEKAVVMAMTIHSLKREVNNLSELHDADATEMEYLDELVQVKDGKLEKQEEQLRLLRGQIKDQEAAMKRLKNEDETKAKSEFQKVRQAEHKTRNLKSPFIEMSSRPGYCQ
ncbi:Hypothetical predicted protein [Cloeon dipterum]|uniref:Uncharacterized protein n=1 Tax=Cloeon dipterum TaxID=197152 RepID=A0A8S1E9U3_9INSE|nr:Hypothetical predicted protein [Cloeon dipterum]